MDTDISVSTRTFLPAKALEEELFYRLRRHCRRLSSKDSANEVTVTGHVNEEHTDPETGEVLWLSVFIYCPGTVSRELFTKVRECANRFINQAWPVKKCIVPGRAIGNTIEGLHYYTFWLPGPKRTSEDFKKFFP